jgi:hypothetical protein
MGLDRIGNLQQRGCALARRRLGPVLEGPARRLYCNVDVLLVRQRAGRDRLARRGIDNRLGATSRRWLLLAVDEVLDLCQGRGRHWMSSSAERVSSVRLLAMLLVQVPPQRA